MAYLGIDLGTGGIRCVLIRADGSVIVEVSRSLPCLNRSHKAGESEQDALDWIGCLEDAFDELFSVPHHRRVLSVAIDSTSGTVLPVNQEGHPLGHAFLHNDVRAKMRPRNVEVFSAENVRPPSHYRRSYGCNDDSVYQIMRAFFMLLIF